MPHPHRYQIEIRGRATERVLRPVTDEFDVDTTPAGDTRMTGEIRDPSHLHGLLAHFTSMNAEVVGLRRLDDDPTDTEVRPTTEPSRHTQQQKRHPAMTIHAPTSAGQHSPRRSATRLQRIGGAAALLAAGTFAFGIAMFVTSLADYTDPDATPSESVDFLVDHQGQLLAWYIGIFIVFGAALVPLGLALRERLVQTAPLLANAGMVFAAIWAGLMFATGMISNIGIEAVADLTDSDPDRAVTVWSTIDTVTNGLGGGNELVGGLWILLVSIAGLLAAALPRWLNVVGIVTAVAGLITVVPDFEAIEMVFGLGSIVWFIGIGVTLLRDRDTVEATA